MRSRALHPLSTQYAVLFGQLQETEPIGGTYDVEWWGPYFIPRARQWHRSRFLLYGGRLYGSIEAGWTTYSSTWDISSGEIAFENASSYSMWNTQEVWTSAFPDMRNLAAASAFARRIRSVGIDNVTFRFRN